LKVTNYRTDDDKIALFRRNANYICNYFSGPQDHKRSVDGDRALKTGGMRAY